jgi:trimeric autotransporter adhesin
MKRILTFALILTCALLGCTQKTTSNVSSIQIIPGDSLLNLNGSRTYSALGLDANGNALKVKGFTWNSSNLSVASVSDGEVTALSLGSSQITASANGITSPPVNIRVLEALSTLSAANAADLIPVLLLGRRLIAGIGLNPSKFAFPRPPLATDLETAPYGSSVTVSEDPGDADGDSIPNNALDTYAGTYKRGSQPALTYSGTVRTQDTSTSHADVTGEVSNLKLEGTLNGAPYSYTFNARQSLKNNGTGNDSMTLKTNATLNLTAFGRTSSIEFASSAQFVPDDAGNPLAGGTFDWQDTINFKTAASTKILGERGEGVHLGSCGQYDSGRIVILDASASLNVLEFGPGCGEVQFSRDGNKLEPTLGGINLEPTLSLTLGATANLPVSVMDLAGRNLPNPVTWTSSNPAVVSVNQGNLNALATGTATISASSGGKSTSSSVNVTSPQLSSITVTPSPVALKYAQTQQFTATATTTTGQTFTLQTGSVTWASSAPNVASIGATTGLATASATVTGTTFITATAFGKTSSPVTLSVSAPTVATITVSPVAPSIPFNGTQAFTAIAKDALGNVISGVSFTWASSATNVATISADGLATAKSIVGSTLITASAFGKISNSATLGVTAPTVAMVTVAPVTASIPVGGTQTFTAIARDASNAIIPNQIFTWTSSLPTVATINASGLASASATITGTTGISASTGGKTSSPVLLTVTDFTLTSIPTPLALTVPRPLTTAGFTATLTPSVGFTGTITYTLEGVGLPVGVVLTPPVTPVVLGATAISSPLTLTVPITVASTTTPYSFNLVATSNTVPAIKHTLPITLTVSGP